MPYNVKSRRQPGFCLPIQSDRPRPPLQPPSSDAQCPSHTKVHCFSKWFFPFSFLSLRIPAPGPNPICGLSRPNIGNRKALTSRTQGESCPPCTRLGAEPADSSFWRKNQSRPRALPRLAHTHTHMHSYIPSPPAPMGAIWGGEGAQPKQFLGTSAKISLGGLD